MNNPIACLVVASLLAACSDSDSGSDLDLGTAVIAGQVTGATPAPVSALLFEHPFGGIDVLVLSEDVLDCADVIDDADGPGLDTVLGFPCAPAGAGELTIGDPSAGCNSGATAWALVEDPTGEDNEFVASSGSITIESIEPGASGTFVADFGAAGQIDGSFNAIVCP